MKQLIKVVQFLLIISFSSTIFLAQAKTSGSIKGKVVDAFTNDPLPFANIVLVGTARGTASDMDGNFKIKNINAGSITVEVSYLGYNSITEVVNIRANSTLEINFELKALAIEGNEVVVTAQAEGQLDAINQQLNSNTIKNVVSSARIQEIPDANAAESVGRLPGISIKRSGGEGNKIVIRGLSPQYNTINLNGVKMPSTGSNDRSTDVSMISPYMLEGIEVTKAITPDQDADVLGGSVNFKIKKAPKNFRMNGIVQGGYNGLEKSAGDYKVVLSGSNRFFENKLGVFAQVDIEKRNRSADELNVGHDIVNPSLDKWNAVNATSSKFKKVSRNRDRYGAALVFDYKLDEGSIIFSNFGSKSKTDIQTQSENFNASSNSHNYSISDNSSDISVLSSALNFEYDFNYFRLNALVANAFSENKSPLSLSYNFIEKAAFTNASGLENPFAIVDSAKNNIQNTYINSISASNKYNKENQFTVAADIEIDLNFSDLITSKLKFGGKYRHQFKFNNVDKDNRPFQPYRYSMDSVRAHFPWMNDTDVGSATIENLPYQLFIDADAESRDFLDGQFKFGPVANFGLMHELFNMLSNTRDHVRPGLDGAPIFWKDWPSTIRDDYNGTEDYSAAFIMSEINVGNSLMILPGVRYESNSTEYTASRGDNSRKIEEGYNYHDTTMTRNNEYWLPMLHLKYNATPWLDFRFAYTNTLTRPNYSRIIPGWHLNSTTAVLAYKNFRLKPGRATNYDLSVTVYENYIGFFNVGVFYKNITDLVYNPGNVVINNPADYDIPANLGAETISTTVNNKHSAEIKGIELDWQTHFWYLPEPFNGMVLNVNYTHIKSETKYPKNFLREIVVGFDTTVVFGQTRILPIWETTNVDTFYTGRVVNQPSDIINVSLGYDYKGFSSRISMQYTDNILSGTNFWEELTSFTDTYVRWDLALKQKLPLEGLQVYYNLNNFTNAIDRSLIAGNSFASSEEYYGMTMDLGIRYSF